MLKVYDALIIGAGAAGLMAAITAKRAGAADVLLLDSKEKIGAKILMSGGTRCNLTNEVITPADYHTGQKNIAHSVLKFFSADNALMFFNDLGISTVREAGGKFFPSTHSGASVLSALLREIDRLGIRLECPRKVSRLSFENGLFIAVAGEHRYQAKTVLLTTGGLSYPATGSDGSGYGLAKAFGHSLIPTSPALTPLVSEDKEFHKLSGVSLPAKLSLWKDGNKQTEYEGDFLFTHFGFSGPVVLDISREWIRGRGNGVQVKANFMSGVTEERFREKIMQQLETRPGRQIQTFLTEYLPLRFVEIAMKKCGILSDTVFNQLKKEQRQALINFLYRAPLEISGELGYKKAEVTAGGIDLSEVKRQTLESKLQPGLFFAGEILDVDGRIGGFNFQWAWSSGAAAGKGMAAKLKEL